MTEYLQIKIDCNAYNVALAILHKEFALMQNLTYTHQRYEQLERAIGAFYAAALIKETPTIVPGAKVDPNDNACCIGIRKEQK